MASSANRHAWEPQATAEYLDKVFTTTHASVSSFVVHDYSVVNHKFISSEEAKTLAVQIAFNLGLKNLHGKALSNVTEHMFELSGNWKGTEVLVAVNSLNHMTMGHTDLQDDTTLVIRAAAQTTSTAMLASALQSVSTTLENMHIPVQIDAYIHGTLPQKLNPTKTNQLVNHTLATVGAHAVEALRSEQVTSVSAYAPEEKSYILTNQHKMNLQVALHYNITRDQTDIFVGTPIIIDNY